MTLVTRDPATGLRHGGIRHPEERPPTPYGCRWCGDPQNSHGRAWVGSAGMHAWERPTNTQILARMKARRAARKAVCRCTPMPMPFAPQVDPYRCEADDCTMHDHLIGLWLQPLSAAQAARVLNGGTP